MATNDNGTAGRERPLNFLEEIIEDHINSVDGRIHTRFPPEPNGYLHIGHAKSICLNFGLAERYGGLCNLRFDDTNPVKEDVEYVDSIKEDIRWLGFRWAEEHYASDYFEQLYAWAVQLIKQGLAYVDDQSQEEIRQTRGTVTVPGTEVRLRYSYLIKCEEVVKDNAGNVVELRCTYDPQSGNGSSSDGRRVKGVIHWVSVPHARAAEVRLYSNLFTKEDPNDVEEGKTFLDYLNPDSVVVRTGYIEPSLAQAAVGEKFQFERVGYFCVDPDSRPERMVFNRTVGLKDTWAKIADK